jgi:hypothetical protein
LPGGGDNKYNDRNAHHIIPQEHARILFPNENLGHMPAVNLPRRDHMDKYHGRLDSEMANIRRRFPDLNNPEARTQTWGGISVFMRSILIGLKRLVGILISYKNRFKGILYNKGCMFYLVQYY